MKFVFIILILFPLELYSEEIKSKNITFSTSHGKQNGKLTDCTVNFHAKNNEGIGIGVWIRLISPENPTIEMNFIPTKLPNTAERPVPPSYSHNDYFIKRVKSRPKATYGDLVVGETSISTYDSDISLKYRYTLMYKSIDKELLHLQKKIILDEEPLKITFRREEFDKTFIYEINTKGLVKELYKNAYTKCFDGFMAQHNKQ